MDKVYLFTDFKLDCQNWTLYGNNKVVSLAPKLIDTLIYLVEHAGKVVSYEDLLSSVWPDAVVSHGALSRNISIIRTALGDNHPYKIIQTVKNRGYVFSVPVTVLTNDDTAAPLSMDIASADMAEVHQPKTDRFPPAVSDRRHSRARNFLVLTLALAVIAIAMVLWALVIRPRLHRPLFVATQITTNSETIPIAAAAISPGGNKIAFADGTGLYVGDITGFERHPVLLPDGLMPSYVQWLPDEFHLLVTGTDTVSGKSSLWKTAIMGGKPTLLLENVSLATVSADGQRIAFIRNSNEMWIVDSDGANARLLTKVDTNKTFRMGSRISADGQSVIMGTYDQFEHVSTIASMHIDNAVKNVLYESRNYILDFLLLNDKELLIAQEFDRKKMETELALVTPGKHTSKTADTETRRIAYWQDNDSYSITASYSNKTISLVNARMFSVEFVADLQNGGDSINSLRRINHPGNQSFPIEWLGDNRTLLFMSNDNGPWGILSQRMDSTDTRALVKDTHDNRLPAVSADQRWLFYFSRDVNPAATNAPTRLMKKPLAGGEATVVDTRNEKGRKIRCAKKINFCVVSENEGNKTVFVAFDPDSGRGNELYRTSWSSSTTSYDWDLSADGTRIGYIDLDRSPAEVHIVYLDQFPVTSATVTFGVTDTLRMLRWDAEANGFFASSSNANGDTLSLLHLYTNGSVKVLQRELNSEDSYVIGSPDGKYLAFNKWLYHSNIWLLQRQSY